MAKLVIKDLDVDASLDAAAMKAVSGGAGRLLLLNTPNAAKLKQKTALEESKLVRGLVGTTNFRGALK